MEVIEEIMTRPYYLSKAGRLSRKDNTIYFETEESDPSQPEAEPKTVKRAIPVEDIDTLFIFGEVDLNTKVLNFLAQHKIAVHIFNYYGYYSGSYYPREYLNSGFVLVKQVEHYTKPKLRLLLAREFVLASAHNILRNLKYYHNRGIDLSAQINPIQSEFLNIESAADISIAELMGMEGHIRNSYYQAFSAILKNDLEFTRRVRRPPDNIINALISFGNGLVYSSCLTQIYRTTLTPTISFLHEPGDRRFSLSLDIAEIFKPILADRIIFKLLNNRELQESHFDQDLNYCYLKESGRRIFIAAFDEKLKTTIEHRRLKRKVSYERLIRLECYKLVKHLTEIEPYSAFRAWW
jgi:CRISP-associated protein Cas1